MNELLSLLLLLVFAELFEAYIQHERTFLGVINKLYRYYAKSVFLFFLVHPTLYIVLFISLVTGVMNFTIGLIMVLKLLDLFYKTELIKKLHIQKRVPMEMMTLLSQPTPLWFFFLGVITYPSLVYFALS
jgi:hypothetical protein